MATTKLIVGLGNPGEKYAKTRHNAGFMLIDELAKNNLRDFVLSKSDQFMNDSGTFVAKLIKKHNIKLENLYVAHDDLDLSLGEFKIQLGRGPKIHNGVNSVEETLNAKDFWRIRIGVDNRDPENRTRGEEYVLEDFTSTELEILNKALERCSHLLKTQMQTQKEL